MRGLGIRIYTDEDVPPQLAEHQWSFGDLLRRMMRHLDSVPPEEQNDIARNLAQ